MQLHVESEDLHKFRLPQVERVIEEAGAEEVSLEWVSPFEIEPNDQIRAAEKTFLPNLVERYARGYKRGDILPALVTLLERKNSRRRALDGNNRLESARRVEISNVPVYTIHGHRMDSLVVQRVLAKLNDLNGQTNSAASQKRRALMLVQQGLPHREVMELTGLAGGTVSNLATLYAVDEWLKARGFSLEEINSVFPSYRTKFKKAKFISEDNLEEMFRYTVLKKLDGKAINEMTKAVQSAKNVTEREAFEEWVNKFETEGVNTASRSKGRNHAQEIMLEVTALPRRFEPQQFIAAHASNDEARESLRKLEQALRKTLKGVEFALGVVSEDETEPREQRPAQVVTVDVPHKTVDM